MKKKVEKETEKPITQIPEKRLSLFRLFLGLIVLAGTGYFVATNFSEIKETIIPLESKPWFAPYVDVTATPLFEFEKLGGTPAKHVMLSFIVASSTEPCTPTWGNAYDLERAEVSLDLDRRIARLRQLGGDVAVSFGGLLNNELAVTCKSKEDLLKAYRLVVDRYKIDTIDLDIEGQALLDTESIDRRSMAIAELQSQLRSENKNLAVWLTLPVATFGLTQEGANVVSSMLKNGVDLTGINVMTMNYGQSRVNGQSMFEATKKALMETHRQLGVLYTQEGINLSNRSIWKKIGATPMIGQNDIQGEIFTLEEAKMLNKFIREQGIIRASMWSVNRDIECGENYVNITVVSDSCSGLAQDRLAFSYALGENLLGNFEENVQVTVEDGEPVGQIVDDPESSPYRIWSEEDVYLEGTKVVWKKNVYQAKWWTQGDLPNNPVLQSWQTPWQLIGPVLPGEKPIAKLTLPEGTYPAWSGNSQYDQGERVLFNGVPYQAKWWTQGDSPAAASSNPTSSPWVALTQAQVEEVIESLR